MAMVIFQPILPTPLKDRAMRFAMRDAVNNYVRQEIRQDFERTVRTWEEKPEFYVRQQVTFKDIMVTVYTEDEVYNWVNFGTNPHIIESVNGVMHFLDEYIAKTAPGDLDSFSGGEFGDDVFTYVVYHPGIEPREFEHEIAKYHRPRFVNYLQKQMAGIVSISGHSI